MYMSTFSIFPTLVLQSVGSDLQHQWLQLSLWFLVIAFNLSPRGPICHIYQAKRWFYEMDESGGRVLEVVWLCPAAIPYRFRSS